MEEKVNPENVVPINNDVPAAIAPPITRDLDSIKFTIATPHTYDSIYKSWFAAYERLTKPRNTHLYFNPSLPLDVNRNECVEMAIENGSEYILFLDHDNIFDPRLVVRMLEKNVPIIGGLYFERKYPYLPVMYTFPEDESAGTVRVVTNYPSHELVKVDGIGMGCCLVKMEVFNRIPQPWFSYEYNGHTWGTEDIAFFYRLRDAGIPLYMDTKNTIGHLSMTEITEKDWLFHKDAYLDEVSKKAKELGTDSVFLNKSTQKIQRSRYGEK